ncbi:hypothetical protein BDV19DRAFT_395644 [Aspergillus venezuelensis]
MVGVDRPSAGGRPLAINETEVAEGETATNLTTLPANVLSLITILLHDHGDKVNLASACRQLRSTLLPSAFASISANINSPWGLSSLVYLILANSELGAAVKSLSLTKSKCKQSRELKFNKDQMEPVLRNLTDTKRQAGRWRDSLLGQSPRDKERQNDAWAAILLTLLPNLEDLEMDWVPPRDYRVRVMETAIDRSYPPDTQPPFRRLTRLVIPPWKYGRSPLLASEALKLFQKLSLREFSCHGVLDDFMDRSPADKKAITPYTSITHLRLFHSNSGGGFVELISACEQLEAFTYENGSFQTIGEPWNPPAIYKSLLRHKSSLTEIQIYDKGGPRPMGSHEYDFLGSLEDFLSITKLRLPAGNILDWNMSTKEPQNWLGGVLPPGLQSLSIDGFNKCPNPVRLIEQLEDLMRNSFPGSPLYHLRRLEIRGSFLDCTYYKPGEPLLNFKFLERGMQAAAALLALQCSNGVAFTIVDSMLENIPGCESALVPKECYTEPLRALSPSFY